MILSGILSIASGIFGSVSTAIINYKTKKLELQERELEYKYEIEKIKAKSEAAAKLAEAKIQIVESKFEGKEKVEEAKAFRESTKHADTYLLREAYIQQLLNINGGLKYITRPVAVLIILLLAFVDFLKALIRPGVTIFELCLVTWLTHKCYYVMESMKVQIFTVQYAQHLFDTIISVLLELFLVVIGWYFSDRRIAKDFAKRIIDRKVR